MYSTEDLDIGRRLLSTLPLIVRTIAYDIKQQEAETGLTFSQFFALNALSRQEYLMSELSTRLVIAPSTTTGIVDRLVAKGWVKRCADPQDRRVVKLRLTDEGRDILSRVQGQTDQRAAKLVSQLDDNHKETLGVILAALQQALEKVS